MNRQLEKNAVFLIASMCLLISLSQAQQRLDLNTLLDSIERNNPVSLMYEADIRSMDEAAEGAGSWMPPEIGAGLFMTPYNTNRWKAMDNGMNEGMGSFTKAAARCSFDDMDNSVPQIEHLPGSCEVILLCFGQA